MIMAEYRAYTKEELAQMPFGEVVDYINELCDEIVELKRALEGYRNRLDKKEDYIGRLQNANYRYAGRNSETQSRIE